MLSGADSQSPEGDFPQPHNIEAEQALLGALLVHNGGYYRIEGRICAADFYDPLHAQIFEAIAADIAAGRAVTPITLKPRFEGCDPVGHLSVPQYLGRLVANAVSAIGVADYAERIRDLSMRRALLAVSEDMRDDALRDHDAAATALVERAERQLFDLGAHGSGRGLMPLSQPLTGAMETVSRAYQRDDGIAGIPTGIRRLDSQVGGLVNANMIVLAGRPAMGKTALGLNIAVNVARAGYPVAFFSLEMSAEELTTRIISGETGVPVTAIRRGTIDAGQFAQLSSAAEYIRQEPLYIDETGGASIDQIAARARRAVRTKGVRLVVVDYLQIMRGTARSRYESITDISNGLKTLAKELDVPVIALSQLNRANESRDDKRPQLADLRESGAVEQDADMVWFVHRDEYYLARKEPDPDNLSEYADWQTEMSKVRGKADLLVAKNRHGPCAVVRLNFDGANTRFSDGDL
ncbi:MAG: replicative DNA helicase [bacterium]